MPGPGFRCACDEGYARLEQCCHLKGNAACLFIFEVFGGFGRGWWAGVSVNQHRPLTRASARQVYLARWHFTEVAVKVLYTGGDVRQQEDFRRGAALADSGFGINPLLQRCLHSLPEVASALCELEGDLPRPGGAVFACDLC
jgi:hypothetical protein